MLVTLPTLSQHLFGKPPFFGNPSGTPAYLMTKIGILWRRHKFRVSSHGRPDILFGYLLVSARVTSAVRHFSVCWIWMFRSPSMSRVEVMWTIVSKNAIQTHWALGYEECLEFSVPPQAPQWIRHSSSIPHHPLLRLTRPNFLQPLRSARSLTSISL